MVRWIRNFKWPWVRNREILNLMQHSIDNIKEKLMKARVTQFIIARPYKRDGKVIYQILDKPISLEDLLSRIERLEERNC